MISLEESIKKFNKKYPNIKIGNIAESDEEFIFMYKGNDKEGFDTVNKKTGEIDFIWIWDFVEKDNSGKIKDINFNIEKAN